jgi:hypothetical protein
MLQGFVSPLDLMTKQKSITIDEKKPDRKEKAKHVSNTSKPFKLDPVVRFEKENEDTHSLKAIKVERLDAGSSESFSEESLNEELLLTQHMSELSIVSSDNEEWYTLIGILVLLLTLLGNAMIGVVANLVPASSGFVQLAQRSGVVALVSALPAYLEY